MTKDEAFHVFIFIQDIKYLLNLFRCYLSRVRSFCFLRMLKNTISCAFSHIEDFVISWIYEGIDINAQRFYDYIRERSDFLFPICCICR